MTNLYNRGLVALSADPITYGHLDIITRAAQQCKEVIVLITNNDQKKGSYLFSLSERESFANKAIALRNLQNVRVLASEGLLVDIYLREDCDVIFRGVRDENDRNFESMMMWLHGQILPELQERIVYIPACKELQHVSSSMVKAFVSHDLEVSRFVPVFIQRHMQERMKGQYKLGVTGSIASGKTFICNELAQVLTAEFGIQTHIVNIDILLRKLYDEDSAAGRKIRNELVKTFGSEVVKTEIVDGEDITSVNRSFLSAKFFSDTCSNDVRKYFTALTAPHVERLYRQEIAGKRGLILFEWALLAEMNMASWTNHNCLVVESSCRTSLAVNRGMDASKLQAIASHQLSSDQKIERLAQASKLQDTGMTLVFTNRYCPKPLSDSFKENDIHSLAQEVLEVFPGLKAGV